MKLFSYLRLRFNEFAYNMHRPRILRLMGASTVLPGCLMPIFSFLRGFFRIRQILTFDVPMGVGNIFILLPSLFLRTSQRYRSYRGGAVHCCIVGGAFVVITTLNAQPSKPLVLWEESRFSNPKNSKARHKTVHSFRHF